MIFEEELKYNIMARCPLLAVISIEEEHILASIKKMCEDSPNKKMIECISWDNAFGFKWVFGDKSKTSFNMNGDYKSKVAIESLEIINKYVSTEKTSIFVLLDFHMWLDDKNVIRYLKNLTQKYRRSDGGLQSIILVMPEDKVPIELNDEIIKINYPFPNMSDIKTRILEDSLGGKSGGYLKLDEESESKMIRACLGFTRNQALGVCSKIIAKDKNINKDNIDKIVAEKKIIIKQEKALEFYLSDECIDVVGGHDVLKDWLKMRDKVFTEDAKKYGLPFPKGLLLMGIPGSGKSLIAKTISNIYKIALIKLNVGALFGSYVGQSEHQTEQALRIVETFQHSILWIDEIEKAFSAGDRDGGTVKRVFGSILTWMSEKKVPCFIVATANQIEELPPELLRAGRFDAIFFLDLPNLEERKDIVKIHIKKRNRDIKNYDIDLIAKKMVGFVGSEIEQVIVDSMFKGFFNNREFATEDIISSATGRIPLAISHKDSIDKLRKWVKEGRAISSSSFTEDNNESWEKIGKSVNIQVDGRYL